MISALADCKASQELERVLLTVDMASLVDTTAKAQAFVQLCRERFQLSTLSVKSLAHIIYTLEKYAANQQVVTFVQECLCAKPAKACTALKMEVDQLLSLHDLVFCRIQNKRVRDEVLTHFDAQAAKVKASGTFAAPVKLISYVKYDYCLAVWTAVVYVWLTISISDVGTLTTQSTLLVATRAFPSTRSTLALGSSQPRCCAHRPL